ncbi:tol-pal system YbgF family protein [Kitasatospora sp. NPDC094011]|uniref:tetratricopeptide repeat protein n=1 Tax=Kitasatospora sp. NPDC094011 TaxID=3364090 RepID=UPI00380AA2E4
MLNVLGWRKLSGTGVNRSGRDCAQEVGSADGCINGLHSDGGNEGGGDGDPDELPDPAGSGATAPVLGEFVDKEEAAPTLVVGTGTAERGTSAAGVVDLEAQAITTEATRQVGWAAFDQGRVGLAQSYFDASLRASAECGDVIAGAYTLSFAAIQCYSSPGLAGRAVSFVDTARTQVRGRSTPRMEAMLAARAARAWSKGGAKEETKYQLHLARAALDKGRHEDDPGFLYWVDYGEIEMIAGSSALELGDPAEALRRFEAGMQAYPGDEQYPRSHAIYLARAAEAHLALHDLDAAVATGRHAAACLGAVDSARSASQLRVLRGKLAPHTAHAGVRDFLEAGKSQKFA